MATDRILFATESLAIGRFRCLPDDVRWRRENWIGPRPHVVFPSRSVLIEQEGQRTVLADPNHVVLYDAGQTYHRELVSPDGDAATYVVVAERLVQVLLRGSGDAAPRFGRPEVALAPEPLLQLQLLVAAIGGGGVDALEAEESMLGILEAVLGPPDAVAARIPRRARTRDDHARLVLDTKRLVAQRFAEPLSLAQIGHVVGASPYHLSRMFRARTGRSLHEYREQIRLRHALDRLATRQATIGIASLAAESGFGSPAHFDARFRRTFGRSPREVRSAMAASRRPPAITAPLIEEMRTITKVEAQPRP
jgi:AraC family transcriptional regulator